MLDQIEARPDGDAQALGAGGVGFRDLPPPVGFLDQDLLLVRRESDQRGILEMGRPAVLDEIRPLVKVAIDSPS